MALYVMLLIYRCIFLYRVLFSLITNGNGVIVLGLRVIKPARRAGIDLLFIN